MGERLHRELQRQAEGRVARQGVFYTPLEVKVLTEQYRQIYNRVRPHSSLGYRPPASETLLPARLEVWPESHWPGFALRQVDGLQSYMAW